MDTEVSQSMILPEVVLNILGLLEAEKGLNSWKLSQRVGGKFSLSFDHVPATGGLTKCLTCVTKAVFSIQPSEFKEKEEEIPKPEEDLEGQGKEA